MQKIVVGEEMKIGYMRINPNEENEKEIIAQFKDKEQLKRVFWEKLSVKGKERKEYDRMMEYVREGDEIIVPEFARFSKTLMELVKTIEELNKIGVILISKKEDFNSGTEDGIYTLKVLKMAAEFEKTLTKQRQKEGIEAARAAGKYKGRGVEKKPPKDFVAMRKLYYAKELSVTDIADFYSVSRPTIYKWLKEAEAEEKAKQNKKQKNKDRKKEIIEKLRRDGDLRYF